jgi:sRNA-binding protein
MLNDYKSSFALTRGGQEQALPLRLLTALLVALVALACVTSSPALAQKSKRQTARASQTSKTQAKKPKDEKAQAAEDVTALRDEFVRLTGEYKKSLGELVAFYERDAKQAEEKLGKLKELSAEGLVAKRDVEAAEKTLADAKAKVAETRKQMEAADAQVAQALVEEKVVEQAAAAPAPPKGKMLRTTAYIRYTGSGSWSLSAGAGRVMSFYQQTFGRQLPISAFGQTGVHNQLGFDHRNAMDVALSPASREGQALIAYLQSNGIPFFAFYMAIPGSATGAHIHVGMPSHRISQPLSTH